MKDRPWLDTRNICRENNVPASYTYSRDIKYNWQIKAEDLTPREIKTDGVPRALLRREREKRRAADAFFSFHLTFVYFYQDRPPLCQPVSRRENKLDIYRFRCKCFVVA